MVANGDGNKQVWLLEFGWTTDTVHPEYSWYAVTPEQQADYIVRAYKYAKDNWSPWIGPMFVWNIAGPDLDARTSSSTGGASPTRTARPARPSTRSRRRARPAARCRKPAASVEHSRPRAICPGPFVRRDVVDCKPRPARILRA